MALTSVEACGVGKPINNLPDSAWSIRQAIIQQEEVRLLNYVFVLWTLLHCYAVLNLPVATKR